MSRTGVGVYGYGQNVMDVLVKIQPSPILLNDPPVSFYLELRAKLPDAFIILRRWRDQANQPLDHPLAAARDFSEYVLDLALQLPGISAVMSYNEIAIPADPIGREAALRHYDMFQVDFISEVQIRFGIPVISHNFGVGNPQIGQAISPYSPKNDDLIKYMLRSTMLAKYYGVHAYSAFGEPMDGPAKNWYALRYRYVMDSFKAIGRKLPPIIFTESGTNTEWRALQVPDPAKEYLRQVSWFQGELDKDGSAVIGQCLFGLFGDGKWSGFDLLNTGNPQDTEIIDLLTSYNKGN